MKPYLTLALLATALVGCSSHPAGSAGSAGNRGWNRWVCDSNAQVIWRYVEGSTRSAVVDLRLGDDDVVHHLEEQPGGSGAFYSDGLVGFSINGDRGLVYWVESNDLIGRDCRAR